MKRSTMKTQNRISKISRIVLPIKTDTESHKTRISNRAYHDLDHFYLRLLHFHHCLHYNI